MPAKLRRGVYERAEALSAKVDALQDEADKAHAEIAKLNEAEAERARLHEDELLHVRDSFERLRTRALRSVRTEVGLLEVGLHAARLNPPKLHVMIDHAERAISGLREEAKRLVEDGQGDD
jgi:hypothetical protein